MKTLRLLVPLALAALMAGEAQASPLWVLPSAPAKAPLALEASPRWVGASAEFHRAVLEVVPGQHPKTPLKALRVYSYYGDGRVLSIQAACKELGGYYDEWAKVQVEDVTRLVPARGWRWDDSKKKRADKLGAYLFAPTATIRDVTVEGYNRLDWSGGGAVVLDSGATVERVVFRGNASAGLRLTGKGNVVRDCDFEDNTLRVSDVGQLYQGGRGKGGDLVVARCSFKGGADLPADGWGRRRFGLHIDDGASDVMVKDSTFSGGDGAVCVNGGTNVLFLRCTFKGNRQDLDVGGRGTVTLKDCTFDGRTVSGKVRLSDLPKVVYQ